MKTRPLLLSLAIAATACGADDSKNLADGGVPDDGRGEDVGQDAGDRDVRQDLLDSSDPSFCTRSSECVVRPDDCCQANCERSALNVMNGVGFRNFIRSCLDRGCMPCRVSARWVPRCVENRCTIVDLDSSSFSACRTQADCQLRWGTACCELCLADAAFDLVSVSTSAAFCAPDDTCDPCRQPPFPATARAVCVDEHCEVQQ